jgi:hypothetical protein
MSALTYPSRPTSRPRRTKADMAELRGAIFEVLEEIQPATVRQTFYQLVSRGVIAKTEEEYKNTVVRLLTEMRRERVIPFGWVADNTRWMRKPTTYGSLTGALTEMQRDYRRRLWDDQDRYVEIWLEKEALAGVLTDVTKVWDVPLMVTRGYPASPSLLKPPTTWTRRWTRVRTATCTTSGTTTPVASTSPATHESGWPNWSRTRAASASRSWR